MMKCFPLFLMLFTAAAWADPAARFQGSGKADPIRVKNLRELSSPVAEVRFLAFDLAWDHSWRAAWSEPAERHGGDKTLKLESWDAAWVFVKFRRPGDDRWSHATLSTNTADHIVPEGTVLDVGLSDDRKRGLGAFVHRAKAGRGPVNWKGITVAWQNVKDGIENPSKVEWKVFAIQMVYVPEGAFWLGDGFTATYPNEYGGQFEAGMSGKPLRIESENALLLGGEDNKNLGSHESHGMREPEDFTSDAAQILPAEFPKGYGAFYCMRHEITEAQWVEYLNMQTYDGQKKSVDRLNTNGPHLPPGTPAVGRGAWSIKIKVSGVAPADGKPGKPAVYESSRPFLPCGGLVFSDCLAYSAWTGLRPMTELEYEKACRGPLTPVPGEYAWGTAKISGKTYHKSEDRNAEASQEGYVLQDAGTANERLLWKGESKPDAETGNAVWQGAMHRDAKGLVDTANIGHRNSARNLRVGIFATPTSGRVAAGASYWGILDLSGNMWERVMVVGSHYGREFAGKHGMGAFGIAGPRLWGTGSGLRGGIGWPVGTTQRAIQPIDAMRVSYRRYSSLISPYNRGWYMNREPNLCIGFRCVRTATITPRAAADAPTLVALPRPMKPTVLGPRPDEGGEVVRGNLNMSASSKVGWEVGFDKVSVAAKDGKTATITFDITWEESFRDEHNHDAAWVFFKTRANEQAEWKHVKLVADKVINPTGYGKGTGTSVDLIVPGDADGFTGVFVRRADSGEGTLNTQCVKVIADLAKAEIRAYGIRMIYVPDGPYFLGSGGVEHGGFFKYTDGAQRIEPYQVASAGAIATGKQNGKLWARKQGGQLKDGGQIPASFPNGFAAFYAMNHQITAPQYAAFLNSLTKEQAKQRYAGNENWDEVSTPGDLGVNKDHYSGGQGQVTRSVPGAEEPYVARVRTSRAGAGCFGLSWADGVFFAAWAGLRPMTELELEKMVRGSRQPQPNEVGRSYWGVAGFNRWNWNAFKNDPQSERAVTVSNEKGLNFKGTHGLGSLTLPADWPQADAVGSGIRCSLYGYGIFDLARPRLSDRLFAAIAEPNRRPSHKWRGVRTAPRIKKNQ